MLATETFRDGVVPGLRARQELGASVRRVGPVLREAAVDEHVGDPLHPLARHAHAARDVGDAAGLVQHAADDLPPGGRQPALGSHLLRGLHEPAVEQERGEDHVGERLALGRLRLRLGHAWDCMSTGKPAASPSAKTCS